MAVLPFLLLTGWGGDTGLLEPVETGFPSDTPDETVIVDWQMQVVRARRELESTLEDLGWNQNRRRRGDWVIYTNPTPWKPMIMVHDDGWMKIRRRGVHFSRPDVGDLSGWEVPLELALCVIAPFACVHLEGLLVSDPILERQKQIVVSGSSAAVGAVADTIANRESSERLENLPVELDSIWLMGIDPLTDEKLPDFARRRALLLERWLTPADNPYGDAVRRAVEDYLSFMVQVSDHPLTQDEIDSTNTRRQCQRILKIRLPN